MVGPVPVEQKVGLPVLLLGVVLFVVTLASPHWGSGTNTYGGLWNSCVWDWDDYKCQNYNLDFEDGWVVAVQVLEVMALLLSLAAGGMLVLSLFLVSWLPTLISALLTSVAGSLGFWGVHLFFAHIQDGVSMAWCFYLNIVSDVIIMLSGFVLYVGAFRQWTARVSSNTAVN